MLSLLWESGADEEGYSRVEKTWGDVTITLIHRLEGSDTSLATPFPKNKTYQSPNRPPRRLTAHPGLQGTLPLLLVLPQKLVDIAFESRLVLLRRISASVSTFLTRGFLGAGSVA